MKPLSAVKKVVICLFDFWEECHNAQVHEQLGHLFLQKGDFGASQREFARACELDPGKSSLHFLLGQAYKRLGRKQEADAEFATAARLAHDQATPTSR